MSEHYPCEIHIYKIFWDASTDVYVGHTWDMKERKRTHIKGYNYHYSTTRRLHQAFSKNDVDKRKYEILETKWCKNEREACELEKMWWKKLDSNLNMYNPYLTPKEEETRIKIEKKQYRTKNKEIISEKAKLYRDKNEEELREKRWKRYYDNQEERKRQARERYHRNKDEINHRRRELAKQKREQTVSLPSQENI